MRYVFVLLFIFSFTTPALADCANPVGEEGVIVYNTSYKTMQFCNGDQWIAMAGGIGGAAALPDCLTGATLQMGAEGWECKNPPTPSCKSILDAGDSTGDGLYMIDPDGSGGVEPFEVYCDMANGGWTRIINGPETTLADLQKFGDTSAIAPTFTSHASYGVSWGSASNAIIAYHIDKIGFTSYKITYSGFYNSPSGGLGYLYVSGTADGSSDNSLFFVDVNTTASSGQTLHINGSSVFSGSQTNVTNRTDTIAAYSPYILMRGYSGYSYTRRYINEFWVQ